MKLLRKEIVNIRRELIALAVRVLANETTLVRKPELFEVWLNDLLGFESYDQQMARNIEVELDRVTATIKRVKVDREFKKITKNV